MNIFLSKLKGWAKNISPTKFFVTTTLIFGLIFIVITPPFQAPDEPIHFFRAYQVSELNFVVDKAGIYYGGWLPKSLEDTITLTATDPILKHTPNKKYDIYKTERAFSIKENVNEKRPYEFAGTALYSPLSYLPQATGVGISRLLELPPIVMMYMGRLMNLIVWTAMLALSIRLIPRKKWALAAIALLPMALFQATSLSVDVMTVGILALTFSLVLKLREQKKTINNKTILFLLALLTGLALSKQIMFLFLPLIFLIPNQVFGRKPVMKKLGLIFIPLVVLAIWFSFVKGIDATADKFNNQDSGLQTKFVAKNPHSFINVLWNTHFFTWGDTITGSFIGNFGWHDTPIAEFLVVLGYTSLLFLMLANYQRPKQWLKKHEKLFLICLAIAYWLAVSTALYIYFSPVGYKIIVGLQGRYFLPLAILATPILYSGWLRTTEVVYKRVALLAPIILLVASTITLYVRYYVNNV